MTAVASFDQNEPQAVMSACVQVMGRKFAVLAKGADVVDPPGAQYAERVHITKDYGERTSKIVDRMSAIFRDQT